MTNSTTLPVPRREAPWLGIGASGQWTDYRDALAAAQLDFTVHQTDAYWAKPVLPFTETVLAQQQPGVIIPCDEERLDNLHVNVRGTDNRVLGVVTDKYGVVQNEDAFSLLEPFTKAGGVITNAGMTEQGLCFMVLRMRQEEFLGDVYDFDVMCCNSFNTRFPLSLMMVPTRIVCQNMYRKLLRSNDMLLHIRHGSNADDRLKAATAAVGLIGGYMSSFGYALEQAECRPLSNADVWNLLSVLFPYPKPGGKHEQASMEKVDLMRQDFYNTCYLAQDNAKFRGTGMGFLNAYYDWLSHRPPTKNMAGSWEDRRLSGLVSGNDIKTTIIERCLA
jgi:hypothetical protein